MKTEKKEGRKRASEQPAQTVGQRAFPCLFAFGPFASLRLLTQGLVRFGGPFALFGLGLIYPRVASDN